MLNAAATINNLSGYSTAFTGRAVLLLWLFWPGSAFFVVHHYKDYNAHIDISKSLTFFPGSILLGIIFIMLSTLSSRLQIEYTNSYLAIAAIIAAIFAIVVQKIGMRKRPEQEPAISPSKITHDLWVLFVYPWLIGSHAVCVIARTIKERAFVQHLPQWIILSLSTLAFIGLLVLDIAHSPDWRH